MFRQSKRVKNSGNKLKSFAAKKGLIIGGKDTCQGDSGGPLWVEEDGKVRSQLVHLKSKIPMLLIPALSCDIKTVTGTIVDRRGFGTKCP